MFLAPASALAVPAVQGLSPAEVPLVQDLLDQSVSATTRASYTSAWRSFEKWAQARAVMALPASPALIAGYLSDLAEERQVAVATVGLYRPVLASVHKARGH